MTHSCVAIFCEDIREELAGTHSVVGVMPDNINLAVAHPTEGSVPVLFPKMGIYLRVNLDPSRKPRSPVSARVEIPGADDVLLGEINSDLIEKAYADGKSSHSPVVGLIFKSVLSPVQFREPGSMVVYAKIDGKEIACGALNILIQR